MYVPSCRSERSLRKRLSANGNRPPCRRLATVSQPDRQGRVSGRHRTIAGCSNGWYRSGNPRWLSARNLPFGMARREAIARDRRSGAESGRICCMAKNRQPDRQLRARLSYLLWLPNGGFERA